MSESSYYSPDSEKEVTMVTIPKEEYGELLEDQRFLQALEAAGVDNWVGYDIAKEACKGSVG